MFLQRQGDGGEPTVSAIDVESAVDLMGELDGFAGIATGTGQRGQSDGVSAEGDGVVGGDDALVMKAEATIEIEAARQAAEVAGGLGRRTGEAPIVVGAEAVEHGVGLGQGGGLSETKFADQAILTGAPDALDAALGLRGMGGDLLDAELLESASELSGSLLAGELFGDCPVGIVTLEDAVAIAIETERDTVRGDHGVQSAEIAEGILGFELEMGGQDLTGGIVLKADQGEGGAAAFEPVMTTSVGERHHAEAGAGWTARTIFSWPSFLRRGHFGGAQNPAHGFAAEGEVLFALKFFRQMGIVEALILAARQGQDQLPLGK